MEGEDSYDDEVMICWAKELWEVETGVMCAGFVFVWGFYHGGRLCHLKSNECF